MAALDRAFLVYSAILNRDRPNQISSTEAYVRFI